MIIHKKINKFKIKIQKYFKNEKIYLKNNKLK